MIWSPAPSSSGMPGGSADKGYLLEILVDKDIEISVLEDRVSIFGCRLLEEVGDPVEVQGHELIPYQVLVPRDKRYVLDKIRFIRYARVLKD